MQPNPQQPSPVCATADFISVHSVWPTIQGEGPFAGVPATFIRLHGCNLQCPFCDTDYTQHLHNYALHCVTPPQLEGMDYIGSLLRVVKRLTPIRACTVMDRRHLVVITGGEPFRQNLAALVDILIEEGFLVQIETNGTFYQLLNRTAVVVCSPKTPRIHPDLAQRADAFKYVLDADHIAEDGLPAGTLGQYGVTARPPADWTGDVFVQPLDEQDPAKNSRNLQACVNSAMRFGYRLCIQTHKLANLA